MGIRTLVGYQCLLGGIERVLSVKYIGDRVSFVYIKPLRAHEGDPLIIALCHHILNHIYSPYCPVSFVLIIPLGSYLFAQV